MTLPVRRSSRVEPQARSLFDWDPFTEWDRLNRQMSELFERAVRPADGAFLPAADLEETDDAFVLEIELPGVKREDIDVEVVGRRLSVSGERRERERVGILRRQTRSVGRFHYEVVFPADVSEDEVKARYHDGVLTLEVPKAEKERSRKIKVS